MSSHPAAVACLLPTLILQVGCRVCTHGGEHGLAPTADARMLLPLLEHKPCDQQVEVHAVFMTKDAHDCVSAGSEVHSCLTFTWEPMSGGSVKTQRPRPRCSGTCTAGQTGLQAGIT
jgi:hypothetical protein